MLIFLPDISKTCIVKKQGLVIVYTGKGKGKTTAALGMALRAIGYNHKVCMIQFIKGSWHYGEMTSSKKLEPEFELAALLRSLDQLALAQLVHDRAEEPIGDGKIEDDVARCLMLLRCVIQVLPEPDIGIRIVEVAPDVRHALHESLPSGFVNLVRIELCRGGADEALQRVIRSAKALSSLRPLSGDLAAAHDVARLNLKDIGKVGSEGDLELKAHRFHAVIGDFEIFVQAAAD